MKEKRICEACCEEFEVSNSKLKKRYCSNECIASIYPSFALVIQKSVEAKRKRAEVKNENGLSCINCNNKLVGNQKKFCCNNCNCKYNKKDENTLRARQRYKEKANILKQSIVDCFGGGCMVCSYNKCLKSLTFHHLSTKDKKFTFDTTSLKKYKKEDIILEAKKCICVCHNCHNEIHDNLINGLDYYKDIDLSVLSDDLFYVTEQKPIKKQKDRVKRPISQFDLNGVHLSDYDSTMDCCRQTNFIPSNINKCCNNERHSAHGFLWKFKD